MAEVQTLWLADGVCVLCSLDRIGLNPLGLRLVFGKLECIGSNPVALVDIW